MIKRIVKLTINKDEIPAFQSLFEEIKNKIRNFPGCHHLELWADINEECTFFTYSFWDDEAALNRYRHSELFAYVWPALKKFFTERAQAWSVVVDTIVPGNSLFYGSAGANLALMLKENVYSKLFIICDENTAKYCLPAVQMHLNENKPDVFILPAGEAYKQPNVCGEIWKKMFESAVDRKGLVVNIGGGVITDIGGFAASTYMRGVDFVNIPTSLLAMIDASVGGKTGVDLEHWKNGVGVFSDPVKVFIDPSFLTTLPKEHIHAGFAEALKHGVLDSEKLFDETVELLESGEIPNESWLKKIVAVKENIVNIDPHEKNIRKYLNFGHTVGHALESYYLKNKNEILHGVAVAWGMVIETQMAMEMGLISTEKGSKICDAINKNYIFPNFQKNEVTQVVEWMSSDKKNVEGQIGFSLPTTFGCMKNVLIEKPEVERFIGSIL